MSFARFERDRRWLVASAALLGAGSVACASDPPAPEPQGSTDSDVRARAVKSQAATTPTCVSDAACGGGRVCDRAAGATGKTCIVGCRTNAGCGGGLSCRIPAGAAFGICETTPVAMPAMPQQQARPQTPAAHAGGGYSGYGYHYGYGGAPSGYHGDYGNFGDEPGYYGDEPGYFGDAAEACGGFC